MEGIFLADVFLDELKFIRFGRIFLTRNVQGTSWYPVKKPFEIQAPGLDAEELLQRIEDNLSARGHDPDEAERVANLSFTPVSPGVGGFDPALTTELFERPIAEPKFTSKKFRYLKGPLRFAARRVFRLLSQIFMKLSENKIQAFYNVVHELIALNHRYAKLQERFEETLTDNLRLRSELRRAADLNDRDLDENDSSSVSRIPQPPPGLEERNRELAELLSGKQKASGDVFIADDSWGFFARLLRAGGFADISLNVADASRARIIRTELGLNALDLPADAALASFPEESLALAVFPYLAQSGSSPEVALTIAASRLRMGGLLALRWSLGSGDSPFTPEPTFRADEKRLLEFLNALGLERLEERKSALLGPGGFEWVLRRAR